MSKHRLGHAKGCLTQPTPALMRAQGSLNCVGFHAQHQDETQGRLLTSLLFPCSQTIFLGSRVWE